MSESKHTPGPWEVVWHETTGRPWGIEAPNDAGIPGAVGCVVRRAGIGLPSSDAAYANARLIAAAPDLLEACQAAMAYDEAIQRYAGNGKQWVQGDDLDKLYNGWISASRAAIAKAKGEQS